MPVELASCPPTSARYSRLIVAALECGLEMTECAGILRHDQEPGGVAIDPVNDPPPALGWQLADLGEPSEKSIGQGPARATGPRMHDDACRLVHNDDVVVLVGNGELDRRLRNDRLLSRDETNIERIALEDLGRGGEGRAAPSNATCIDRPPRGSAAHTAQGGHRAVRPRCR